ncbi:MAG: DUF4112 domain-containing protein [Planctomycetaceae bacterium]
MSHINTERLSTAEIPEEIRRLERIEQLSHWLDTAYKIPIINFRIGWDTIIDLFRRR